MRDLTPIPDQLFEFNVNPWSSGAGSPALSTGEPFLLRWRSPHSKPRRDRNNAECRLTIAWALTQRPVGRLVGLTSPPAEAGRFFPRGLSFLLLRQQLPRINGK
ncbi:hypothetical protein, partial [Streptomyces sp. NPDC006668]|uniref:hypothetical protein n=1 Tax=Streptomyces sp. NPDC006668 TaxID=3156903 RepID=UPI0033C11B00